MSQLTDGFGRSFPYLRLSLTEACNFRCGYCLPEGYQADGRPRFLQVEEISRLVRAFAALGMSKIRLTGGEPSLRKDLDDIIAAVAAVLTPPDVISQIGLGVPLYMLYEISIVMIRLTEKKRAAREAEEEAAFAAEMAEMNRRPDPAE
jgi:cyclic pyranopterin phosphate synthase